MKLSYKWLQSYFDEPLPSPEELAKLFTMQLCEIEGIEKVGDDTQIDAKELPDRACYLLGHKFFADEIGALLNIKPKTSSVEDLVAPSVTVDEKVGLKIQTDMCNRHIARIVTNVSPKESPAWLVERLATIGQKSINLLVDLTNYVNFELGQPMHAFDKDKIKGTMVIRNANEGEEITTLDGKKVTMSSDVMVIADDVRPLDIAGVKGGEDTGVSASTTAVILEAANFDRTSIRKTSQKVGIRNDSSKRFENGVTPERAMMAMELYSSLLAKEIPEAQFSAIEDVYPNQPKERTVTVDPKKVKTLLGIEISDAEMLNILARCGLVSTSTDAWTFTIPAHRLDIADNADVSEEVGRIYGYDKLPHAPLSPVSQIPVNKVFSISNKIRAFLQTKGFSEVYTHTLVSGAQEVLANPLNADRGTLRDELTEGIVENITLNLRHKDYLGLKEVKVYEIGHCFYPQEHIAIALGIGESKKEVIQRKTEELTKIWNELCNFLGVSPDAIYKSYTDSSKTTGSILLEGDYVIEANLDELIRQAVEPSDEILLPSIQSVAYEPIVAFPYSIRDVAVFVPGEATEAGKVLDVIRQNGGANLAGAFIFDVFTKRKEGEPLRTSYAYRMKFQSKEKTLSEDEITAAVTKVTEALRSQSGWEVR